MGIESIKSGGSLGVWDIVAWDHNSYRHIQVKTNRPPSTSERTRIEEEQIPFNASKEIWIYVDGDVEPIIQRWDKNNRVWFIVNDDEESDTAEQIDECEAESSSRRASRKPGKRAGSEVRARVSKAKKGA